MDEHGRSLVGTLRHSPDVGWGLLDFAPHSNASVAIANDRRALVAWRQGEWILGSRLPLDGEWGPPETIGAGMTGSLSGADLSASKSVGVMDSNGIDLAINASGELMVVWHTVGSPNYNPPPTHPGDSASGPIVSSRVWAGALLLHSQPTKPTTPTGLESTWTNSAMGSPSGTKQAATDKTPPACGGAATKRPRSPAPQPNVPTPQDMRGSASPKGEARRRAPAKPARSARRGREDYGWGWAGGVTKPNQVCPRAPPPCTRPRQRKPEGRSPAQSAAKPAQSARRGREDYGRGWAGGVIKPNQVGPRAPPPCTHPRQRKPEGRSPAQSAGQAGAKRPARQGGLRVGVGGWCN